jgi:hypothetical protein
MSYVSWARVEWEEMLFVTAPLRLFQTGVLSAWGHPLLSQGGGPGCHPMNWRRFEASNMPARSNRLLQLRAPAAWFEFYNIFLSPHVSTPWHLQVVWRRRSTADCCKNLLRVGSPLRAGQPLLIPSVGCAVHVHRVACSSV